MSIMPRFFAHYFGFAATAATILVAGAAQARPVVPIDLNPGDEYRLVFVTDGRRDATSSNIADYNDFVTNDVTGSSLEDALNDAGLTPEWFAIASTLTTSARENTSTEGTGGVPIYMVDVVDRVIRVADDYGSLWEDELLTSIDSTPSGVLNAGFVWTGTASDGSSLPVLSLGAGFPIGSDRLIGVGDSSTSLTGRNDVTFSRR